MQLTDVYEHPYAFDILWNLMEERKPHESISHKRMPSWVEHVKFVRSRPYADWQLINEGIVGAVYLTHQNEIGIGIFRSCQGRGFGTEAVGAMMAKHGPRRYLANINPQNAKSIALFERLGFRLCQQTYELES